MLIKTQSYINLAENMNTQFDKPASIDANSSRLAEKQSHQWKDESDREMQGRYV